MDSLEVTLTMRHILGLLRVLPSKIGEIYKFLAPTS